MTAKEAKEIILGMDLSERTLLKAEEMLKPYKEDDEIPDDLIDNILLIVDKEIDINKLVEEEDNNSVL